jgi:phosphonopyruvate decarboxylase
MQLGTTTMVGATAPPNLVHVVLDNGAYESTGSQPTASPAVDWVGLGRAVGYRSASVYGSAESFATGLRETAGSAGPHLVVARIALSPGVVPPRVTGSLGPPELRARFQLAVA